MRNLLYVLLTGGLFVGLALYFVVVPVVNTVQLPDEIRITQKEYKESIPLTSGQFITQQSNYSATVSDVDHKYIDLKLFGLFKIKRIKVDVLPVDELVVGGMPMGFVARSNGPIVVENAPRLGLKKGDTIKKVNDVDVDSIEEFNGVVGLMSGRQTVSVEFQRGSKYMTTQFDVDLDKDKHLGLWLKDECTGVGILTYVNPKNNNFAALGHQVTDYETGVDIDIRAGDVYRTNVIGIEKSNGKKVGEFKSTLRQGTSKKQGTVFSSNEGGVFGCLFADSELLQEACEIYPVGSRYSVKPGSAKLRTSIDGVNIKEYDIEIVKTYYQKEKNIKSMIVRIIDKELLRTSGGIIHGMSGSPIIQNGKLVGALTHVIVSDTTKGYGIYIDFVIP